MSKSLLHSLTVDLYPYPCFLNSFLKGASSPCKTLILTFSMVFFLYFFVVDIAPSLTHILLAIMGQNCLLGHKINYRKISHREVDNTLQNSVEVVALQLPPAPCHCHLSPRLLQWPPNSSPCIHPCPYQLFPTSNLSVPLKTLVRSYHCSAQNHPVTSLLLKVKPELGFTFFRSVLKCHFNKVTLIKPSPTNPHKIIFPSLPLHHAPNSSYRAPFSIHSTYHHITYYIFIYIICGRLHFPRRPQDFSITHTSYNVIFLLSTTPFERCSPPTLESRGASNCDGSDAV